MYKSEVIGKGNIRSRVVADSIANGVRLTTLELRYPRFIHSEFMTHRLFSRNASSSRAIPVAKMIEQVENDPAMPIFWGKNQPGMQAREECDDEVSGPYTVGTAEEIWREYATGDCVSYAKAFDKANYHKQIVNRLLEPFQFISVVCTATEWDNFFKLRLHSDAQPEICELARVMKESMEKSEPDELEFGDLHLPYVEKDSFNDYDEHGEIDKFDLESAIKASVARCARVSYLNHDKTQPDIEKDIRLHDMLLESGHFSPFEHVASPMSHTTEIGSKGWWRHEKGYTHSDRKGNLWSGNFRGFLQYRQML